MSRDLEKEFDTKQWSSRITDPKELKANHVDFGNRGDNLTSASRSHCDYFDSSSSFGWKSLRIKLSVELFIWRKFPSTTGYLRRKSPKRCSNYCVSFKLLVDDSMTLTT